MKTHTVYWLHGRTFILTGTGRKFHTGLVIEADGLHAHRVPVGMELPPAEYHGKPYPLRKLRGHLRRMKPATKGAAKLRREVLS